MSVETRNWGPDEYPRTSCTRNWFLLITERRNIFFLFFEKSKELRKTEKPSDSMNRLVLREQTVRMRSLQMTIELRKKRNKNPFDGQLPSSLSVFNVKYKRIPASVSRGTRHGLESIILDPSFVAKLCWQRWEAHKSNDFYQNYPSIWFFMQRMKTNRWNLQETIK